LFVGEPTWETIGLGKLGSIRPSFFLLPLRQGKKLGVPIYEERLSRQKWGDLEIGNWKDQYRKKNGLLCNDAMEIQTPRSR
jgi:hypothetical protein